MKKLFKKAFTLVELVVVIAVIAILSAVAVSAYFGIVNNANESSVTSKVKQVKDHLLIYVASRDAGTVSLKEDGSVKNNGDEDINKFKIYLKNNGFEEKIDYANISPQVIFAIPCDGGYYGGFITTLNNGLLTGNFVGDILVGSNQDEVTLKAALVLGKNENSLHLYDGETNGQEEYTNIEFKEDKVIQDKTISIKTYDGKTYSSLGSSLYNISASNINNKNVDVFPTAVAKPGIEYEVSDFVSVPEGVTLNLMYSEDLVSDNSSLGLFKYNEDKVKNINTLDKATNVYTIKLTQDVNIYGTLNISAEINGKHDNKNFNEYQGFITGKYINLDLNGHTIFIKN